MITPAQNLLLSIGLDNNLLVWDIKERPPALKCKFNLALMKIEQWELNAFSRSKQLQVFRKGKAFLLRLCEYYGFLTGYNFQASRKKKTITKSTTEQVKIRSLLPMIDSSAEQQHLSSHR